MSGFFSLFLVFKALTRKCVPLEHISAHSCSHVNLKITVLLNCNSRGLNPTHLNYENVSIFTFFIHNQNQLQNISVMVKRNSLLYIS